MNPKKVSLTVYLGSFCGMFIITARSVILPSALTELQGEQFYDLAVLLISLSMCIILPISGYLSDIYGRKKLFLIGCGLFSAGCLLSALASNVSAFLLGMVSIGTAYGLINAVQLAVLNDISTPQEIPARVSNISIANSLACLAGPIFGGFFADYLSWKITYIAVIPILLFCLIIMAQYHEQITKTAKNSFDMSGLSFFILFLIPAILLLSGKNAGIYRIPRLVPFLILCVVFGLLGLYRSEGRALAPIIYLLCSMGFSITNYLVLYYQQIHLFSPFLSGLITIPRQIGQLSAGFLLRQKMYQIRNKTWPVLISFLLFGCAAGLMTSFQSDTSLPVILIAELLFGIGYCSLMIITQNNSQLHLPKKRTGSGTALIGLTGALGNTLGSSFGAVSTSLTSTLPIGLKCYFLLNTIFMILGIFLTIEFSRKYTKNSSQLM